MMRHLPAVRRTIAGIALGSFAVLGLSVAPALAAKKGQLCKAADAGTKQDGLTCTKDGTRYRWGGAVVAPTTVAAKTTKAPKSTTAPTTATKATTATRTKATSGGGASDDGGSGKNGRKICSDFTSQADAKKWISQHPEDESRLDKNKDGVPCESLKP